MKFVDWVRSRTAKTTAIDGTEQIHIDDGGTSKKATLANAVRYVLANAYSGVSMALSGNWTLSTPMYEDVNFPIYPRTGSNIAAYTAIDVGGVLTYPQWEVNDYHVCDSNELPHGWKEGTEISWHIHLITNGTNTDNRFVKWELIWAIADAGEVLAEQTTITTADYTIPANTPAKTHFIVPIGAVTLTGYRIGAHMYPRLKRVASSGNAPSANPWVTMLQAHIQLDTLGSTQITSK
jgi:hypothetical protein